MSSYLNNRFIKTLMALSASSISNLTLVPVTAEVNQPTPDQIKEFMADFEEFDVNRDRFLDIQEVRGQFQGKVSEHELLDFYRTADADQDGKVSGPEYITYATDLANQESEKKEDL